MTDSTAPALAGDVVADVIDNGQISGQQILVVGLCMFFNMLDGFDITAMAIVASAVSTELQLTADRLGLIFSFALAGMMAGAMFLAPVSDIIGRRKLIILSITLVGVSVLFTANASSLAEFMALRFISGVGAGAMLACQATLAAEYSPEKYRSLSVALTTAGYPLGAMMTAVVAGFIMPEYGWRGMFWFGGAVTLSMGLVAWLFIPESLKFLFERRPDNALDRVNKILLKLKKDTLTELPLIAKAATRESKNFFGVMRSLLAREHRVVTLVLWTTFFLCFSTLYFLMSWIPKLMEQTGYSAETGHLAFFLFNLGGVLGILTLGMMSTRWKLTNLVFVFLSLSAVCMVIFAAAPNQLNLLLVVIFLMGILQQGGFTGLYAVAAKVYPTEIRSTGIGWAIGLGRSGAVLGPAAAGFLIAAGFSMSANFYIFAIPMALGGFISYWLKVK
ncbi:MAG: MFS transporter [Proteobacteria bacterium]|nr:MFS transporter [Pseudomonadota bacterium]